MVSTRYSWKNRRVVSSSCGVILTHVVAVPLYSLQTDLAGYNDIVPPSTGKKKKARKVFGNILNYGDVNHSLSYTPSPPRDADDSAETQSAASKLEERVATNLFSIEETAAESSIPGHGRKSENSYSQKSTCRSESSTICRSQQSTVVVKPFSKIIQP